MSGPYPSGIGYFVIGQSAIDVPGFPPPGTQFTSQYPGGIGHFVAGKSAVGIPGSPPPTGPVPPLARTIRAYLYEEYQDDDDLQAFVDAYNTLSQEFIDWFNALNLPIYTGGVVAGLLLDWVGAGLYGMSRPLLGTQKTTVRGPLDTWTLDSIALDTRVVEGTLSIIPTTDDLYRRILTWHLQKSAGKLTDVRWLKQRVMQFLVGTDGVPVNIDQTYRVSVSFGVGPQVNITILKYLASITRSAALDSFTLGSMPLNWVEVVKVDLGPQYAAAPALKAAIDSGILELPFQYQYIVNVQS